MPLRNIKTKALITKCAGQSLAQRAWAAQMREAVKCKHLLLRRRNERPTGLKTCQNSELFVAEPVWTSRPPRISSYPTSQLGSIREQFHPETSDNPEWRGYTHVEPERHLDPAPQWSNLTSLNPSFCRTMLKKVLLTIYKKSITILISISWNGYKNIWVKHSATADSQ